MASRRISALLAVLLATALLVGCGSKPAAPSGGSSPQGSPAPASKAPVELNFYFPVAVSGPLKDLVDGMIQDFNKSHPDIKVTGVFAGNYNQTLIKAQASPPDVAVLLSTDMYTLIDQGLVVPLDDFIKQDQDGEAFIKDFFPAFMKNSQAGGKVYGIPFQRSTPVLYYNEDMFKDAGLSGPPETFDRLVAAAKTLTKPGSVWGIEIPSDGYPYWTMQGFMIGNGKNLMNDAGTETYFNDPAVVQALQDLVNLSTADKVEPTGVVAWANVPTDFASGKTAMAVHSSGSLVDILSKAKFKVGLSWIPGRKGFGAPTGGGNLYIFKAASPEKQKAAWTLIRWLTSPEQGAYWSSKTGYIAPRAADWETDTMKKAVQANPQLLKAKDGLKYAAAELMTHDNAQVYKIFNDQLQAIVTGQKQPKAAMDTAQADTDKVLAKWRK